MKSRNKLRYLIIININNAEIDKSVEKYIVCTTLRVINYMI